ncbi:MAG: hypothetical protein GX230_02725, partial [Lentisphaerae bacterium]|nr:hypothetical protein [Lentisphaerota bacterium]
MKTLVLVKQVPDSNAVRMDETTGTMVRHSAEAVVNPLDLYAVEAALCLRERYGGEVVALSMGPPAATRALREVVAMGVDRAVLVSDGKFAGSDTWATSRILAAAIKQRVGDFDLIVCGERATDGDTGQVGPGVAAALGLPVASYAGSIGDYDDGALRVERLIEGATESIELQLPGVVTVVKAVAVPRLPTLDGKLRAKEVEVEVLGQSDLRLPANEVGLAGSPTRVIKIFKPQLVRKCELYYADDPASINTAVEELVTFLRERLAGGAEASTEGIASSTTSERQVVEGAAKGDTWVLAEQRSGVIQPVSFELLARSRGLVRETGVGIGAVVLGPQMAVAELERLIHHGADYVVVVESDYFRDFLIDAHGANLSALIEEHQPDILLGAATSYGRTLMPYVAMLRRSGLTADCTGLAIDPESGVLLQTRPAIGGNIMATITCARERPQMATVRPGSSRPLAADIARKGPIIRVAAAVDGSASGVRVIGHSVDQTTLPLQEAARVVTAG